MPFYFSMFIYWNAAAHVSKELYKDEEKMPCCSSQLLK